MNPQAAAQGKPAAPAVQRDIDRVVEIWEARGRFATADGPLSLWRLFHCRRHVRPGGLPLRLLQRPLADRRRRLPGRILAHPPSASGGRGAPGSRSPSPLRQSGGAVRRAALGRARLNPSRDRPPAPGNGHRGRKVSSEITRVAPGNGPWPWWAKLWSPGRFYAGWNWAAAGSLTGTESRRNSPHAALQLPPFRNVLSFCPVSRRGASTGAAAGRKLHGGRHGSRFPPP